LSPENDYKSDEYPQLLFPELELEPLLTEELEYRNAPGSFPTEDTGKEISTVSQYALDNPPISNPSSKKDRKTASGLTHELESTTDVVKLYLREMGNILLLTKEEEIAIAKEFERGQRAILNVLYKTLLFYKEISDLGSNIRENPEIIRGLFEYDEDEDATKELDRRKQQILSKINKINKIGEQLDRIPKTKKHAVRRGRLIIQMRRIIENLNIRSLRMDRIIDEIYDRLKATEQLMRHLETLNSLLKNTKYVAEKNRVKKQIAEIKKEVDLFRKETGLTPSLLKKSLKKSKKEFESETEQSKKWFPQT